MIGVHGHVVSERRCKAALNDVLKPKSHPRAISPRFAHRSAEHGSEHAFHCHEQAEINGLGGIGFGSTRLRRTFVCVVAYRVSTGQRELANHCVLGSTLVVCLLRSHRGLLRACIADWISRTGCRTHGGILTSARTRRNALSHAADKLFKPMDANASYGST
jgi:hypothetical protein